MYPISYQNNISFKGHCGHELIKYGREKMLLTTETAFGREFDTLACAVKYINQKFPQIKEKKFVIGACSSGEEVWSYKMLMEDNPVKIIGFDMAKKALKQAKESIYTIFPQNSKKIPRFCNDSDGYKDTFLAYEKESLTDNEKQLYRMFHKMFKQIKLKNFIFNRTDRKTYKLRNAQHNCKFMEADIKNLPTDITKEKYQLFSFRNAFYHILTYHNGITREERTTKELKPILNNIFKTINKTLDLGGIFVMGEKEEYQCDNIKLVTTTLIDNGFALLKNDKNLNNIWTKVKEIQ